MDGYDDMDAEISVVEGRTSQESSQWEENGVSLETMTPSEYIHV